MKRASVTENRGVKVVQSLTIYQAQERLWDFWRNLENLPRFMHHLESVAVNGDGTSHWVAKAPAGVTMEWDAEVINEHAPNLLAWRSKEGSDIDNAGSVRFAPAPKGRGTVVTVSLEYVPPGGKVGKAIAKLLGEEPSIQINDDLHHFKCIMEAGEIPSVRGQPSGRNN